MRSSVFAASVACAAVVADEEDHAGLLSLSSADCMAAAREMVRGGVPLGQAVASLRLWWRVAEAVPPYVLTWGHLYTWQ